MLIVFKIYQMYATCTNYELSLSLYSLWWLRCCTRTNDITGSSKKV